MERILVKTEEGVTVICPAPGFTAEFCIKDVPTGSYYKIVPTTEVPSDRTFRNAWEVETDDTWSLKND